jgi:hypothetical protein
MELSGEQGLDGDNLLLAAGAICKRDLTSVRMHGEMRGVHPEPREFGGPPPTGTVTVVPAEGKKAQANEAKVTERGNHSRSDFPVGAPGSSDYTIARSNIKPDSVRATRDGRPLPNSDMDNRSPA